MIFSEVDISFRNFICIIIKLRQEELSSRNQVKVYQYINGSTNKRILACIFYFLFVDLQKMREPGIMAERRDDFEENEDFGDEEDILDLRMPKDGAAKRGGGAKQVGKKRNRGRRGRDKTRFRQS